MKNREEFSFRNILSRIVVDNDNEIINIFNVTEDDDKITYKEIFDKMFKAKTYCGCTHYSIARAIYVLIRSQL